jgi:hypothetical protein
MKRIFVFGSNLEGHHAAGAALEASRRGFPSYLGAGFHKRSRCYAVPTMHGHDRLVKYVEQFLDFAAMMQKLQPKTKFQVTRIGCGIAGFDDSTVASMFAKAPANCLFDKKWEMGGWLPAKAKYWGTF